MPTKYKPIPEELQKIDYGTAKSHYANVRFKQGLPKIAGGDIKKGTQAYNEIVLLQKTLKEKDFVLLLAELADRSPEHWQMMSKYYEKRGWDYKIAGQVLADAKAFYGESNKGPLDSISNLAIAGGGGGPIQEAPKPLPPPLAQAPKVNKGYKSGFLNILPQLKKPIVYDGDRYEVFENDDIVLDHLTGLYYELDLDDEYQPIPNLAKGPVPKNYKELRRKAFVESQNKRRIEIMTEVRNKLKQHYKSDDEIKMGIVLGVAKPEDKANASYYYKKFYGDSYFQVMPASHFRNSQQMKQFRFPTELVKPVSELSDILLFAT